MNGITDLIDNIAELSAHRYAPKEGDYQKDGLWYCGSCNTPKQTRVRIADQDMTPFCACKCAREKEEREEAEYRERKRQERIDRMREDCFPAAQLALCTFDADDGKNAEVSRIARTYVENFSEMEESGSGIVFYGSVGTGKSFYAAAIANALIDKGVPCKYTSLSRLINTLSGMSSGKQDYIDKLNRYRLLIIDDLAAERDTAYAMEIVHSVIDSRCAAALPTIVTTNLGRAELEAPSDLSRERIYSRLMEMCLFVEVKGEDRRRDKLAENRRKFLKLYKESANT